MERELLKQKWVSGPVEENGHLPVFRREFHIVKPIKEAIVYISGVGHFELHVNGKKATEAVLETAWTNYEKSVDYSVYKIEQKLRSGKNCFTLWLGNGMYNVNGNRHTKFHRIFGEIGFKCYCCFIYMDGSQETFGSDEIWRTRKGPISFSCVYGGEDFTEGILPDDWEKPEYQMDEDWIKVHEIKGPAGCLMEKDTQDLIVTAKITAVETTQEQDQGRVYDIGENISGFFHIRFRGRKRMCLKVTPYEMRDEKGMLSQAFTGFPHYYLYHCCSDQMQDWTPKFTYYGFHLLQIEWLEEPEMKNGKESEGPEIELVEGQMITMDMPLAGEFKCSIPLWNQIHDIVTRAMRCNTKSIFTDCPHREKLGWLEQLHLVGPGILYNYDAQRAMSKMLRNMREAQTEKGLVPNIAPEYINFAEHGHTGFRDSPEWGSACIILPWYLYLVYRDVNILRVNYNMMKRYVMYLKKKSKYHILHHGLGDWLDFGINPPFTQNTCVSLTATAIYYYDLRLMVSICDVLRESEDQCLYEELSRRVKKAFNREFYDDQGHRYEVGSQTANALAYFLGIVPDGDEEKVYQGLKDDILRRKKHTTGGDVGYPFIIRALEKGGDSELIADMMLQTDEPSYGNQVMCGATTLCEEWNGNNPKHPSSSQNHFMLGAIEEWFYADICGFKRFHKEPDNRIVIKPYFDKRLDWVEAWNMYDGKKVSCSWKRTAGKVKIEIVLPENRDGALILDGREEKLSPGKNIFIR